MQKIWGQGGGGAFSTFMISRSILHGSDWWKFRFQNRVTEYIQSSFSMQMSIKGAEGQGMQRVNRHRGSRGADSEGVQRVKRCRESRGAGLQGVKGCRGSKGAEGQGMQRVKECRGSRGAESQQVQRVKGAE